MTLKAVPPPWEPGNPNDRSITGFRIRWGGATGPMSRALYYKMRKEGTGPRETAITNGKVVISAADEAAWAARMAAPRTTEERLKAKADAEWRRMRSVRAAARSMQHPNHPRNVKARKAATPAPRARSNHRAVRPA
jgi:hypothetical protein